MSNDIVDDRRGLIFTIDRQREPVYQVESQHWARADHRWPSAEIPPEIHAKVEELKASGKPGAFARFLQGEDGVYVIYEKNIKPMPEVADQEIAFVPPPQASSGRQLAPYDIVICAKGGTVRADNGELFETTEDGYYVIKCQTWARFLNNQAMRPRDVETTKEVLLLLEDLNGKNYLSMSPDKTPEALPIDLFEPTDAIIGITCYVLNLARFKR